MGLGKDVYLTLLSDAMKDIHKDIESLGLAISVGNLQSVQEISHRLKGTTANLRLNAASLLLRELNDFAKENIQTQQFPVLFAKIEVEIKGYSQALEN